jgi:Xaa-Pro aminopeptidase
MALLTRDVHVQRHKDMQALMNEHRLDALIFTRADMVQYATNFAVDVETWERPIALIVTADGAMSLLLNELSIGGIRIFSKLNKLWLDESHIHYYAEHPRVAARLPLLAEWSETFAAMLVKAGLRFGRIGCDASHPLLAGAMQLLPGASLQAMFPAIACLRWQKHPEEIANMRALAELADWVQGKYIENIRPGRLVQELDASMAALFYEEGARRFPGEDLLVKVFMSLSGPASAAPHGDGAQGGARFESGHGIVNAVIPSLNGSVIENERTYFCGKPSSDQIRFYETALSATNAATEQAVAGRPLSGIDVAAQEIFERAGLSQHVRHRTGHGMGILHHEFPADMAFNHRPLLEREVFSVEPALYIDNLGGFRIDNSVVVGHGKPEILTHSPTRLVDVILE